MPAKKKAPAKPSAPKPAASSHLDYGHLVTAIQSASEQAVHRAAVAVNQWLVIRNWLVGAYLVEYEQNGSDRAKYGTKLLERLAEDSAERGVKGLIVRTLRDCRSCYLLYPQIRGSLTPELETTVFQSCIRGPLDPESETSTAIPSSVITESKIRQTLSDEFGQFVSPRPIRGTLTPELPTPLITTGNRHHRVDLVFYHRVLRCHVLIDLKIRAFKHEDAGQMNFYVNWFKENQMLDGDNPPVGIILCSSKDRTDVEFATSGMDAKLFVSRYLVALPSAEQLKALLEADRARIEQSKH